MESTRDFGANGEEILFNQRIKDEWSVRKFLIEKMEGTTPEIREWLHRQTAKEHIRNSRSISL